MRKNQEILESQLMPRFAKCRLLILIALCLTMAGCAGLNVFDNGCEWTRVITVSPLDTQETKIQVLSHDLERKKHCEE